MPIPQMKLRERSQDSVLSRTNHVFLIRRHYFSSEYTLQAETPKASTVNRAFPRFDQPYSIMSVGKASVALGQSRNAKWRGYFSQVGNRRGSRPSQITRIDVTSFVTRDPVGNYRHTCPLAPAGRKGATLGLNYKRQWPVWISLQLHWHYGASLPLYSTSNFIVQDFNKKKMHPTQALMSISQHLGTRFETSLKNSPASSESVRIKTTWIQARQLEPRTRLPVEAT